jgi:spermidine synthase
VTPAEKRFVQVIENRNGIIAADADGVVWGHGMYDGRFNTALRRDVNGVVRPYALSLFHPAPKKVLVIGFASGSWSRVIASHPDLETLTVVEINPSYLRMAAERAEVASVLSDPKVRIVIDDGRRWLRLHPDEKFDAIVSNTTWHFRANATNLLSQEFLQLVASHLAPGGVFFFNTTSSDRVQRTACLTMPHGLRFGNHVLVSNDPIRLDFRRWRDALLRYKVDGQPVIADTAADRAVLDRLLAFEREAADPAVPSPKRMIEWCSDIERRTEGLEPFTDDNMGSEWRRVLGLDD